MARLSSAISHERPAEFVRKTLPLIARDGHERPQFRQTSCSNPSDPPAFGSRSSSMYVRVRVFRVVVCLALASIVCARIAHGQTGLPSPWVSQDIGDPLIAGSTSFNPPAGFTMTAAGADIWGT